MRTARLDASLLARKGEAVPLRDTYASSYLDPVDHRSEGTDTREVPLLRKKPVIDFKRFDSPVQAQPQPQPLDDSGRKPRRRLNLALSLADDLAVRVQIMAALEHRRPIDIVRDAVCAYLDRKSHGCACLQAGVHAGGIPGCGNKSAAKG